MPFCIFEVHQLEKKVFCGTMKLQIWSSIGIVNKPQNFYKCSQVVQITCNVSNFNTKAVAQRWSVRKGALKNFAKFTGKQQCQSLFFNEVAD